METLADWLKEQEEEKAKKKIAQDRAREAARLRLQAGKDPGTELSSAPTKHAPKVDARDAKEKRKASILNSIDMDIQDLPGKRSSDFKKPTSLRNWKGVGGDVVSSKGSSSHEPRQSAEATSAASKPPKSPIKKTKRPATTASNKDILTSDDDATDVEKSPKRPTSLKILTTSDTEDETDVVKTPPKPASLGAVMRDNKKKKKGRRKGISPSDSDQSGDLTSESMSKIDFEESAATLDLSSDGQTQEEEKDKKKKGTMRKKKKGTTPSDSDQSGDLTSESMSKIDFEASAATLDVSTDGQAPVEEQGKRKKETMRKKKVVPSDSEETGDFVSNSMSKSDFNASVADQDSTPDGQGKDEGKPDVSIHQPALLGETPELVSEEVVSTIVQNTPGADDTNGADETAPVPAKLPSDIDKTTETAMIKGTADTTIEGTPPTAEEGDDGDTPTTSNDGVTGSSEAKGSPVGNTTGSTQAGGDTTNTMPVIGESNGGSREGKDPVTPETETGAQQEEPEIDSSDEDQVIQNGVSFDTHAEIANLPGGEHSSEPTKQPSTAPFDERLADSQNSAHFASGESDGEVKPSKKEKEKKKGKKKKKDKTSKTDGGKGKSDDATKKKKPKLRTVDDTDEGAEEAETDETPKETKKKTKKERDSTKKKTKSGGGEDDASDDDGKNTKKKPKKKGKGKDKDKDKDKNSTEDKDKEHESNVTKNIHDQMKALFEDTSEPKVSSVETSETLDIPRSSQGRQSQGTGRPSQLAQSQSQLPTQPEDQGDDVSEGSIEFLRPDLLSALDDYSSDEPSSDSDDDFQFTRVAGINDFDNTNMGVSQRPSTAQSRVPESKPTLRASTPPSEFVEEPPEEEAVDFSSLDEVKDQFPTFAKIMGVWVDRENKLLYKTPVQTVTKKEESKKKEVEVPIAPEAPTFGSMVKKWEAKLVRNEPETSEQGPTKLRNVWAEKLEFSKPFTKPVHTKSADEIKLIEDTVEKNFVFKDLTKDEMAPLVDAFERVEYEPGATIGDEGEPECFYSIVQSGEVKFHTEGELVGKAGAGDAFGELSLLYSVPRAAEATASDHPDHQTVLFQIDQTNFRYILREQMLRSQEEKLALLQSVDIFKKLDESDLRQLGDAMVPHRFNEGDNLSATFMESPFCLVQRGSVTATDMQVGPGESFGAQSLLANDSPKYEVRALSDGLAFTIDRESFEKVFGDFDRVSLKYRDKQTLASIRQIRAAKLEDEQLDMLVRQITNVEFKAGIDIFEFNEKVPPAMYIVRQGRVKVVKKNGEERMIEAGGYFGHEYMLFTSKQSKDIVPDFVVVKYAAMTLEKTICGVLTLQEVGIVSGRIQVMQDIESTQNIAMEDLERHRVLGEGQFGVVWLVTVKTMDTDPYALKMQYLDDPCRDDAIDCIREEIRMMRAVHHQFIIQVVNTYEEEDIISMLLTLAPGGELFDILHRQDVNGWWVSGVAEPIAKFYSMVVADTLAFMHRQKFIYRDLKPENILIDKDGYPVLTDFGFVKQLEADKTYTFCGTPNYIAPEVAMAVGHNASADNWSLGVLIYELIDGANPFWEDGMDQQTLYELISEALYPPIARKKCSRHCHDLVGRLLEKDPSKRLGTFREKDILEHKWFRDFDIQDLREKNVKAPWVPDPICLEASEEE
eukprot:Nitzschia sp. Nitz4//scaffold22_size323478//102097//107031//NITZ4_000519-RA/size323478-processed-gene-0.454-mRNA-1//-1//CDS//3329542971//9427//frame0